MKHKKRIWTDREIKILKSRYERTPARDIADELGCDVGRVYRKAWAIGLKKDVKYINTTFRRGVRNSPVTEFKRGCTPWNKGLRGWCPKGSDKGWFKNGHKPHNTRYNGATRIQPDKSGKCYKFIRIAKGKWVEYHRYVWQKKHGRIPKGHVIIFKNGNTLDFRLNNLKMISRVEHLKRNSPIDLQARCSAGRDLTDRYVAGRLAMGDKELRKRILREAPELIKLKRKQLLIKRMVRDEARSTG